MSLFGKLKYRTDRLRAWLKRGLFGVPAESLRGGACSGGSRDGDPRGYGIRTGLAHQSLRYLPGNGQVPREALRRLKLLERDKRSAEAWFVAQLSPGDFVFGFIREGRWWIPLNPKMVWREGADAGLIPCAVLFGNEVEQHPTVGPHLDPLSQKAHLVVEYDAWPAGLSEIASRKQETSQPIFPVELPVSRTALLDLVALCQQVAPKNSEAGELWFVCRFKIEQNVPVFVRAAFVPPGGKKRRDARSEWVVRDGARWVMVEAVFLPKRNDAIAAEFGVHPKQLLEFQFFGGFGNVHDYGQWLGPADSPPFERT